MVDAPSWFSSLRPLASWFTFQREREREREREEETNGALGSIGQLGSETSGAGLLVCL